MQVRNVLHAACWKYSMQKWRKKSPSAHHCTTLSGCIFAIKACIDNQKKLVRQQYLLHMSPHYTANFDPLTSETGSGVLEHPSKFQRVSHLAFVTAATSLTGGQPNFARCLGVFWAGTLYIHFWGLMPLTEFCSVQNSLYAQVLWSPILATLLHSTPAAGVSQTLQHGTRNGIMELLQRAPPISGTAAITLGIGPPSS